MPLLREYMNTLIIEHPQMIEQNQLCILYDLVELFLCDGKIPHMWTRKRTTYREQGRTLLHVFLDWFLFWLKSIKWLIENNTVNRKSYWLEWL